MTTAATDIETIAIKLREAMLRLDYATLMTDSSARYAGALAVAHLATEEALNAVLAAIDTNA